MTRYVQASGAQLYALLPEHYRDRDRAIDAAGEPHLKSTFNAFGEVLDLVRHTLEQRFDDSFPDTTVANRRCQDWLIPYFAELFAVRLRSPFPDGQRNEVASAVRWSQRKGTLVAAEEIVEAITLQESELREGFRLVATTARIGLPATTVTPDFRRASRAVQTSKGDPAAQFTRFGWNGQVWPADDPAPKAADGRQSPKTAWVQANPNAAPCFPGSYEDVSRRMVDFRATGPGQGICHPKRLAIHLPPPYGFFTPDPRKIAWSDVEAAIDVATGEITGPISADLERRIDGNTVTLRNRTGDSVEITGSLVLSGTQMLRFEKLRFPDDIILDGASVAFHRCAIRRVAGATADLGTASFSMQDTLVDMISTDQRTLKAEYVTVLTGIKVKQLLASDCIFAGAVKTDILAGSSCVRFSRVPESWLALQAPAARNNSVTTQTPKFISNMFNEAGCGVLSQYGNDDIATGAEDGGEMGAGHAWRYAANLTALTSKLSDYLPVGIEPVVVHDPRLLCTPPQQA